MSGKNSGLNRRYHANYLTEGNPFARVQSFLTYSPQPRRRIKFVFPAYQQVDFAYSKGRNLFLIIVPAQNTKQR